MYVCWAIKKSPYHTLLKGNAPSAFICNGMNLICENYLQLLAIEKISPTKKNEIKTKIKLNKRKKILNKEKKLI